MSDIYGGYVGQQVLAGMLGLAQGTKSTTINKNAERRTAYARSIATRELQQFVRRFRWTNLPKGLDQNLMERILYFRGRVVLFKLDDTYYALPFALNGTIDVYGRYKSVVPLTFNGSVMTDDNGEKFMNDGPFIGDLTVDVCYDQMETEGKNAVILNDYTQGISEFIIPRYQLNYVYHDNLADIIVLIRHNLIGSAAIYTASCVSEAQVDSVEKEFETLEDEILLNGKRIFAVTGGTGLSEMFKDKQLQSQSYWECYVSLDNLRENLLGIENNGIFKKKERVLKGEQEIEAGSADMVYADGLFNRQQMCERFNALFGENIWCEESEVVSNFDSDQDGNIDDEEGSKPNGKVIP